MIPELENEAIRDVVLSGLHWGLVGEEIGLLTRPCEACDSGLH